ncbi:sulfotransferase [Croceicoccus sp. F390]|uniref:Sulfotransferase n=1 Tax=Croceicoccus esteveae TaxID=3075597 RepID=A0ABU2ZF27_9SPHN|nr:sulfotransferase [Croceicoccus sp. F390]MDT0574821.1 sulfotransferase [Croceicoccus sp. F390]
MSNDFHDPLTRTRLVGWINACLTKSWSRGWLERPSLAPEALWRKARKSFPSGCEFGGRSSADVADFAERVEVLCTSLQEEARLNPLGRTIAHGLLVRVIRQHLSLGLLWKNNPRLPRTQVTAPVLVVGQMRAGTTRLHRLLAADPALCSTRFCDSWNPLPVGVDLRPASGAVGLAIARRLHPRLDALHPFGATQPDEELGWLTAALSHCALEVQWHIPSYTAWSEERDAAPVYREYARILATDAAHHGNAASPRAMKVPQFAEDLPTLLQAFPDARVVVISRIDHEVLASAASLIANQMTVQSDSVDPRWIGTECRRKLKLRDDRVSAALTKWQGRLSKVDYDEFDRDWQGTIRRCYREIDLPCSREALQSMGRLMERSPDQQQRARHNPAAFGLN